MHGRNGVFLTTCFVAVFLLIASTTPVMEFESKEKGQYMVVSGPEEVGVTVSGVPHTPITIDGDANFSLTASIEGWLGDGSSGNPFIIDGLDIDLGGSAGICISITNTRVNFTISNCNLTSATVNPGAGIYLNNVTNGKIIGNIFLNDYNAIYLTASHNNIIKGNILDANTWGIYINYAEANLIDNNTCTNHWRAIVVYRSTQHTVTNNNCSYNGASGIAVTESTSTIVENNTCNHQNYNGIDILSSNSNDVWNNTCLSNSVDGIYLESSSSNNVSNNICNFNENGLHLEENSDSNYIFDNICCNNSVFGFYCYSGPSSNIILRNLCSNNTYGICFDFAGSNLASNNTCTSNTHGIYIYESSNNQISWNTASTGYDNRNSNSFDYNYWSNYAGIDSNQDGIGDTPYSVGGDIDPHPLMYEPYAPVWTSPLPDYPIMEYPAAIRHDFDASAPSPIATWSVNDTTHFFIDSDGVLESIGELNVGQYGLKVTVANIYGVPRSFSFRITIVLDASNSPGWWTIPTDQILAFGENLDYQVIAIDPSGIGAWELNDTSHFSLHSSVFSGGATFLITNRSVLDPGIYGINITVFDIYSNKLSETFTVTVLSAELDEMPPAWVTLCISQSIQFGVALEIQVEAWDESGIDHWWLSDASNFSLDAFGVLRNATVLQPGAYYLEIRAYDLFSNYCTAALELTVFEQLATTTVPTTTSSLTTPTSDTETPPPTSIDPLVAMAIGGGLGGAGVILIVIILLKQKKA